MHRISKLFQHNSFETEKMFLIQKYYILKHSVFFKFRTLYFKFIFFKVFTRVIQSLFIERLIEYAKDNECPHEMLPFKKLFYLFSSIILLEKQNKPIYLLLGQW